MAAVAAAAAPTEGSDTDALKTRIDAGRARIAELESLLTPTVTRMKTIEEQMSRLKQEIDSLDASKASGTPIDLGSI